MINEIQFASTEWKNAKKSLEESGYRHANYWTRHARITADELRKHALNGKIDVVRVWISGTTKLYYTKDAIEAALKLLGR